jgi:chloramphenicol 3-O-phosphotransferase
LAGLRTRQKHQQQQSKPVNKIQSPCLKHRRSRPDRGERQPSYERWSKNDSGKDFAHDLWLSQSYEQVTEQLRQPHKEQEYEED